MNVYDDPARWGERFDSLDEAWATAEAALPEGWFIEELGRQPLGPWYASARGGPSSAAGATGPTPAAALLALTEKLKGSDRGPASEPTAPSVRETAPRTSEPPEEGSPPMSTTEHD